MNREVPVHNTCVMQKHICTTAACTIGHPPWKNLKGKTVGASCAVQKYNNTWGATGKEGVLLMDASTVQSTPCCRCICAPAVYQVLRGVPYRQAGLQ